MFGIKTPTRTVSRGVDTVILICAFRQGCCHDWYIESVGVDVDTVNGGGEGLHLCGPKPFNPRETFPSPVAIGVPRAL